MRSALRCRADSTAFRIRAYSAVAKLPARDKNQVESRGCRSFNACITQARICRLSLFRPTAFASFLLTEIPTLKLSVIVRAIKKRKTVNRQSFSFHDRDKFAIFSYPLALSYAYGMHDPAGL